MVFPSYEELLEALGEVVTGIESETLTAVFEHWMKRLERVSKNSGDYYPSATSWLTYFSTMSIRNRVAEPEWDTLYSGAFHSGHSLNSRRECLRLISTSRTRSADNIPETTIAKNQSRIYSHGQLGQIIVWHILT
jgi:hypothetical protein